MAELSSLLTDTKGKHDEMLEDMAASVQRQEEKLVATGAKLNHSLNDKFENLSELLDESRRMFSDTVWHRPSGGIPRSAAHGKGDPAA